MRLRAAAFACALLAPLSAVPQEQPAQEPAAESAADPESLAVSEEIASDPSYKRIVGTRVYLKRPKGFVTAEEFIGLTSLRGRATVHVAEEPFPYEQLDALYSDAALRASGMTVLSREAAQRARCAASSSCTARSSLPAGRGSSGPVGSEARTAVP